MPARKRPTPALLSALGRVELLLEEIRAQDAAIIDAVRDTARGIRAELRSEIGRFEQRIVGLELAVRQNSADVQGLREGHGPHGGPRGDLGREESPRRARAPRRGPRDPDRQGS